MTKILCVGDIHVMDKPPVNATESYTDDIIEMLIWIADYAHENDIPTVVWAGDVFHHKQPSRTSHALVLRMIQVVRHYMKLGIELIIVTGNHDISNDVLDTVHEKQPLGVLYAAGAKELVGWHEKLPLYGVPWQQRWLEEETKFEAFADWREIAEGTADAHGEDFLSEALAVTHAPIYPPSMADDVMFELVPLSGDSGLSSAMMNTGFLYYGHIHEDHGIFEVEGVTYANMGAISRGSLHDYNLEREIKVALWTEDGFTEIPVPHKPAAEIFRMEKAAAAKEEKLDLDAFLSQIGTSTIDMSSTGSVVAHIRKQRDIEPRIRKAAIEILEGVEG